MLNPPGTGDISNGKQKENATAVNTLFGFLLFFLKKKNAAVKQMSRLNQANRITITINETFVVLKTIKSGRWKSISHTEFLSILQSVKKKKKPYPTDGPVVVNCGENERKCPSFGNPSHELIFY